MTEIFPPTPADISAAIRQLDKSDREIAASLQSTAVTPTAYWNAAEQLKQNPFSRQPFDILPVLNGLLELDEHVHFANMILYYLDKLIEDPTTSNLAIQVFCRDLQPDDFWATVILTEIAASKGALALYGVIGLSIIHNQQARDALYVFGKKSDKNISHAALVGLADQGDNRAVGLILTKLKKYKWGDGELLHALGKLRAQEALPYLFELSKQFRETKLPKYFYEEDERKSYSFDGLIYALGRIGSEAAQAELKTWFSHENELLKNQTAMALLDSGDQSGLKRLTSVTPSKYSNFQWRAGLCLLRNKYPTGLQHMVSYYRINLQNTHWENKRFVDERVILIKELKEDGELPDTEFLEWVANNDFDQTDTGLPLAKVAQKAINFIQKKSALNS